MLQVLSCMRSARVVWIVIPISSAFASGLSDAATLLHSQHVEHERVVQNQISESHPQNWSKLLNLHHLTFKKSPSHRSNPVEKNSGLDITICSILLSK